MVMKRRVPGILENLLKNKEETRYANLAYVSIVLLTILSFRLFFMQIIEDLTINKRRMGIEFGLYRLLLQEE